MILQAAIVCGRFQPFHNDHLKYILTALGRTEFLWIGVTKPWVDSIDGSNCHREQRQSNPYSFIDRLLMINQSLRECGIPSERFKVIPFDFESDNLLKEHDPKCEDVFMTITDDWSETKKARFEELGKNVHILYKNLNPSTTATKIREKILLKDESWKTLVPPAVVLRIDNDATENGD